jgi:GNAT superfamily N-acetyltransferase
MSAEPSPAGAPLLADIAQRWQAADGLLPVPDGLPPALDGLPPAPDGRPPGSPVPESDSQCRAVFTVPGVGGRPSAVGACEHWHGDLESLELTWGAARRFQLTARVGGPDVGAALDGLLQSWRVHLADLPGVDDPDSAAVVMWPSRDIDGIQALLGHGLAPRSVVAARRASRPLDDSGNPARGADAAPAAPAAPGFGVRRAGRQDADTVVRLGLAVIRFDAHFGGVVERPSTASALRAEMLTLLAEPEPWIWLASRDGKPAGVLIGEPPPVQWIAPLCGVAPVAYNMLTFVSPADRGSGMAQALVRSFHDAADTAGVPATLLHYENANPLSAPFWARHGYRPLWTSWEARPACTMR